MDEMPPPPAVERRVRRWVLPGELLPDAARGRVRRTPRDWLVDLLIFGWALLWWLLVLEAADLGHLPEWHQRLDPVVGLAACLTVWWRRRWPLGLAVALLPTATMINTGFGALLVVLCNAALRLPWRTAVAVLGVYIAAAVPYLIVYTLPHEGGWTTVAFTAAFYLTAFAWGVAVRARRQELLRLRQDAVRQRAEHARRLADTRRAERTAIAREMHDVLAHRISLLSVHAAALAYRTGQASAGTGKPLSEAEVAESAEIIRDNAHQALEELREVLTVLRAEEPGPGAPAPPARVNGTAVPGGAGRTPEPAARGAAREPGAREAVAAEADVREAVVPEAVVPGAEAAGRGLPGRDALGGGRPQPLIADVGALVREAEAAGQRVEFRDLLDPVAAAGLRPQQQRTVYRVVQEGLTNARKHAPGAPVTVELAGRPGHGLTVRVCNPLPAGVTRAEIPGARAGLIGLGERAALDGGSLEHGGVDGEFRLLARLPWPATDPGTAGG